MSEKKDLAQDVRLYKKYKKDYFKAFDENNDDKNRMAEE